MAPLPLFFELTTCVEVSVVAATEPTFTAVCCCRVRGAMLVWQDDDQRVCLEESGVGRGVVTKMRD